MPPVFRIFACLAVLGLTAPAVPAWAAGPGDIQGTDSKAGDRASTNKGDEPELTPEQIFKKRYPQPVRVGNLIGLPVLDYDDSTIGYVREVVRSPDGKISLIVPYSARFGWVRTEWGKRLVAVPIETVTILARQLDADMSREDFDDADTWTPSEGKPIPPNDKTLIALGRR